VRDHRSAASEGDGAGFRKRRCEAHDQFLERIERHRSGRGACSIDQRRPCRPNTRGKVHLVPDVEESWPIDELVDVVETALGEDYLVEVSTSRAVSDVPSHVTRPRA
jgi:hypothetical protein